MAGYIFSMSTYRYPLLYGETNLQDIFTYLTSSFDALFVLEGNKPGARLSINEKNVPRAVEFCQQHGLAVAASDFKVVSSILKDKPYANLGVRISTTSPMKGDIFVYLSKSADWVVQAKAADAWNNHHEFGKLLGYPLCCIDFFGQHAAEEMKKDNDYIIPCWKNSKLFFFENNVVPRYLDIGVLSHFPCSFGCTASRAMAQERLSIVKKYSEGLADHVENAMKLPVVMTEHDGAHILQKARIEEGAMSFHAVTSTVDNALHLDLAVRKSIPLNNQQLIIFE